MHDFFPVLRSYINVYNIVGIMSLLLMLYIFVLAVILQVSKKALDNTLQTSQHDAEAGVYTYELFADVETIMQQSRSINMLWYITMGRAGLIITSFSSISGIRICGKVWPENVT